MSHLTEFLRWWKIRIPGNVGRVPLVPSKRTTIQDKTLKEYTTISETHGRSRIGRLKTVGVRAMRKAFPQQLRPGLSHQGPLGRKRQLRLSHLWGALHSNPHPQGTRPHSPGSRGIQLPTLHKGAFILPMKRNDSDFKEWPPFSYRFSRNTRWFGNTSGRFTRKRNFSAKCAPRPLRELTS